MGVVFQQWGVVPSTLYPARGTTPIGVLVPSPQHFFFLTIMKLTNFVCSVEWNVDCP